jgi:lysophospholipase L1-like esterase
MKRERAFWPLMVIGTLVVAAVMIELFVRVVIDNGMQFDLEMWKYAREVKQVAANPLIGHQHRPGSHAHLMGVDVAINSKGLRDREIPYERTPGTLRILMLGDSFTEGWGVALPDTFAKRLEQLYAARGVKAEVINAGVGNYNTVMEVNYFLDEGRTYDPDIVVLNFTFNDAEPVPPHETENALLRFCEACVYLAGRTDTLMREASLRADWKDYYLHLYADDAPGWRDAKAALTQLANYTRAHHQKLLVASLPDLHQLDPYPLQSITDLAQRAARDNGANFVDVLPALKTESPLELWVTPTDPHPNAKANALIAAALFRKLTTME